MATLRLQAEFDTHARFCACSLCGSQPRPHNANAPDRGHEAVLDLGLDIEYEGSVQICETCAVQIGHEVGLVSPDGLSAAQAEADVLRAEAEGLANELSNARDAVRSLSQEIAAEAQRKVQQAQGRADTATARKRAPAKAGV